MVVSSGNTHSDERLTLDLSHSYQCRCCQGQSNTQVQNKHAHAKGAMNGMAKIGVFIDSIGSDLDRLISTHRD